MLQTFFVTHTRIEPVSTSQKTESPIPGLDYLSLALIDRLANEAAWLWITASDAGIKEGKSRGAEHILGVNS